MTAPRTAHVPPPREPEGGTERQTTGEEAMEEYRAWRKRVLGDRSTKIDDVDNLLAYIREEPGS